MTYDNEAVVRNAYHTAEENVREIVLECLKRHGQRLDLEIAEEIGMPLATVRIHLAELETSGEVIMCKLTRFGHGKRIDAWQCRASGYSPAWLKTKSGGLGL